MTTRNAYVLGAGMAGLAAATHLAEVGCKVTVFESAPQAGGRCRSFFDKKIDAEIDNGNHLVLSGNTAAMAYLKRIDAMATVDLLAPDFPFIDLQTKERWTVSMNRGRIQWKLLLPRYRVPGSSLADYWNSRKLMQAGLGQSIKDVLSGTGALYEKFWKPLSIAVLNTEPEQAAARLLQPVIRETLGQGGDACRPVITKSGLAKSFVDPALGYLENNGALVRLGTRCRKIEFSNGIASMLTVDDNHIKLSERDIVISALPPSVTAELIPNISVPDEYRSIVNAHFKIPARPKQPPITGLVGGLAEWLFVRGEIASVTISAADSVVDQDADDLKARIWREIAPVLGLPEAPVPASRIIKEKRATIAQTSKMVKKRPKPATEAKNLWLAGDWTDTGLPATIEGAIRSGHHAAGIALNL